MYGFTASMAGCQNETLKASTAFWRLSTSPEAPVCQSRLRARGMPVGAACLLVAPAASSFPPAKQKVQRLEDGPICRRRNFMITADVNNYTAPRPACLLESSDRVRPRYL